MAGEGYTGVCREFLLGLHLQLKSLAQFCLASSFFNYDYFIENYEPKTFVGLLYAFVVLPIL